MPIESGPLPIRRLFWAVMIGVALFSAPLRAEPLPSPAEVALPSERAVIRDALLPLLDDPNMTLPQRLAALDAALARLDQPTKLRGFIQALRGAALAELNKADAARAAMEESIRLLPGYSAPLFGAVELYTYSDQPGRAVDYFLRASRIDPDLARKMPDYDVQGLLRRLRFAQDQRRIRAFSERLIEIDWQGDGLASRSGVAREVLEGKVAEGDIAGAKALIPKLVSPWDARALLIQRRYDALWPDLERWSGLRSEKLWPQFLAESRESWRASQDLEKGVAYASALAAAGHDKTLIREFLPLFSKRLEADRDHDLLFIATTLAGALAREGRWDEIEKMYGAAQNVWPLGKEANALNLAANRARYLLAKGDAKRGLELMDAAIADAARWGDEVNGDAVAIMHQSRACMLHVLGRGDTAIPSRAIANSLRVPSSTANLYLCLGNPRAARDILIQALGNEQVRENVLSYVQPGEDRPTQSEFGRIMQAGHSALRADPVLLAAIAPYGRVLPHSLSAGAPAEEQAE